MKNIFVFIFLILVVLEADCDQVKTYKVAPKPDVAYVIADFNSTTIAVHLENNNTKFNNISLELPIDHGLITANLRQTQTKDGWMSVELPIVLHCKFKAPRISLDNSKKVLVSDKRKLIVINLEAERMAIVFGNSTESLKKSLSVLKEMLN